MNHVSATANICERLFSRGKLIYIYQRGSLDPSTLEDILILRCNRDSWDVHLVQHVYEEETKRRAEARKIPVQVAAETGRGEGLEIEEEEKDCDHRL